MCSTKNLHWVRSIGADRVIHSTERDFSEGDARYDLIMDQVGNHTLSDLGRVLAPGGKIQPNTGHGGVRWVFKSPVMSMVNKKHAGLFVTKPNASDLDLLRGLIESGKIKPVIDRTYTFNDTPAALEYASQGLVRGKVVITVP